MVSGSELLKKGYILTSENCPKCGKPLFKDPKTGSYICANCGYKKVSEKYVLKELYDKIIEKLSKVKPEESYKLLKALYILKKILK